MKPALFSSLVCLCGLIAAPLVSACVDATINQTAPTVAAAHISTVAAPVADVPNPPVAPPAIPPPPKTDPFVPLGPNDFDFRNLSAIRGYNKNTVPVTITLTLNSIACDQTFGSHTVTIQPKSNGYFTLPQVSCGSRAQIDGFYGNREGDCKNPDFAGAVYTAEACPPPPPPPPCVGKTMVPNPSTPEPPRCPS